MADGSPPRNRPLYKKRSSSISAPVCSSLETVVTPPPDSGTSEFSGYKRRRPATRSQSARMTGPRSVRRKPQPQAVTLQDSKGHCTSEPKLNEYETPPPQKRSGSQRRVPPIAITKMSKPFLDVPQLNVQQLQIDDQDDADNYRLRTFSSSKQGLLNVSMRTT